MAGGILSRGRGSFSHHLLIHWVSHGRKQAAEIDGGMNVAEEEEGSCWQCVHI